MFSTPPIIKNNPIHDINVSSSVNAAVSAPIPYTQVVQLNTQPASTYVVWGSLVRVLVKAISQRKLVCLTL